MLEKYSSTSPYDDNEACSDIFLDGKEVVYHGDSANMRIAVSSLKRYFRDAKTLIASK